MFYRFAAVFAVTRAVRRSGAGGAGNGSPSAGSKRERSELNEEGDGDGAFFQLKIYIGFSAPRTPTPSVFGEGGSISGPGAPIVKRPVIRPRTISPEEMYARTVRQLTGQSAADIYLSDMAMQVLPPSHHGGENGATNTTEP